VHGFINKSRTRFTFSTVHERKRLFPHVSSVKFCWDFLRESSDGIQIFRWASMKLLFTLLSPVNASFRVTFCNPLTSICLCNGTWSIPMARRFWKIQISFAVSYNAGRWTTHTYLPPSFVTLGEFPQSISKETNVLSTYRDKLSKLIEPFKLH